MKVEIAPNNAEETVSLQAPETNSENLPVEEGDKIKARYVLVRNMSEVSGNDFGSAADIAVILAK